MIFLDSTSLLHLQGTLVESIGSKLPESIREKNELSTDQPQRKIFEVFGTMAAQEHRADE